MRKSKHAFVFAATTLLASSASTASAEDWPSWRGPSHNGTRSGDNFPTDLSAENIAWKIELPGKGASSPVVWKERIFLTAPADGVDAALAFDLDGKQIWKTVFGPESKAKHVKLGTSSNASPVTDGKGVFVHFKSGTFAALEMDGSIRWKRNLVEEFGPQDLYWDQGSSPVIAGDLLILSRLHGGDSWVAGFDKQSGKIRWKQERNYDAPAENDHGYSTPIPIRHGDKDALLVWGADHLTTYAADDGALLWSSSGFNPKGTKLWPPIATPVVAGDIVVVPVGRDDRKQASTHAVRLGGKGEVTKTHHVWKRDDFGVFVSSPIEYEGRVYLLRHKGELVCLDPKSGDPFWTAQFPRSAVPYYASPVIAGGIIYAPREDGVVFTARIGEDFELLGEQDMGEQILATPVPLDGRLLIRTSEHLICVE